MLALLAAKPAGGAALDQVAIASGAALLLTAGLLWLGLGHRSGTVGVLGRLGRFSRRVSGLPDWAAIPAGLIVVSLITALFGMLWDISLHIAQGRDNGPLANPAHYFILGGLFGVFSSGFLSMCLPLEKPSRAAVKLADGWYAPLGGVLIAAAGAFSLIGFPLDDVWHRLFGQDVTLWGPTHVMMIGGAGLSTLGLWVLIAEGRDARRRDASEGTGGALARPAWVRARNVAIAGAFLLGLSALQGEFDFGVPQFRLVLQPVMLMLAAGIGLVTARIVLGRLGALQAVLFFLVVRGLLTLAIGPLLGESTFHAPLYLAEALLVELVAVRVPRERPVALGAWSGVAIGTIGLAAEWGWSHVWMPLPWPSSLLPEAALLGFAAAVSAGVVGGYIGRALSGVKPQGAAPPRWLLPVAGAVAVFCLAYPIPMTGGDGQSASFQVTDARSGPDREVNATVQLSPPDAADNADWLTIHAWQGGGLVADRLERIGPGRYRTTEPIPVSGEWKAMLRLADGRQVVAAPLYMPEDTAIPAKGVPAESGVTRPLVADKKILQREAVGGSAWLTVPAYLLLLLIATGWIAALTWGLRRLERGPRASARTAPDRERRAVSSVLPRNRPA
jgi:hypothetical protein